MSSRNLLIGFLLTVIVVLFGAVGYLTDKVASSSEKQAVADPIDDTSSIPAQFHGEWNAKLSDCGTGQNESRLRITRQSVRFYESLGSVAKVKQVTPHEIEVNLTLTGEGETWISMYRLVVSADGKVLTDKSDSEGLQRFRCP